MSRNRIAPALLFFVLVCPFLGIQGWLHLRKVAVRKQVKRQLVAGIDEDELVLLRFSKSDTARLLRWEHAKEFEFKGEMYDIVSFVSTEDSIFYRCWWDNEETVLGKQLNQLTALAFGLDHHRKERQSQFNQFVKSLFFSEPSSWQMSQFVVRSNRITLKVHIQNWSFSPPSPPPEA